jgi:hypothetical protein
MEKSIGEKPVPLIAVLYVIGIEFQSVENGGVVESKDGNQDGDGNDDNSYLHKNQ